MIVVFSFFFYIFFLNRFVFVSLHLFRFSSLFFAFFFSLFCSFFLPYKFFRFYAHISTNTKKKQVDQKMGHRVCRQFGKENCHFRNCIITGDKKRGAACLPTLWQRKLSISDLGENEVFG